MEFKEINNHVVPTKEQVRETVTTLDAIKHIDENGKEYWNAHELAKALQYNQYQQFKPAIKRAITQMENSGDDPEKHLSLQTEVLNHKNQYGTNVSQNVKGYKISRKGAYAITLEADPSKPAVAVAHRYMVETTRKGEVAELIFDTMKDKEYIDERDGLRLANKELSAVCLQHDVKEDELGIVHNAGDEGMFGKTTKQLKQEHGIPDGRPTADFLGTRMATAKKFAQQNARDSIERQNANGVNECSNVVYDENRKVRELVIEASGKSPENLITGEDVKRVEQRYKNLTKKQLAAIEQEF